MVIVSITLSLKFKNVIGNVIVSPLKRLKTLKWQYTLGSIIAEIKLTLKWLIFQNRHKHNSINH